MKNRLLSLLFSPVFLTVVADPVPAVPPSPATAPTAPTAPSAPKPSGYPSFLGLTEEQQAKLRALSEEARPEKTRINEKLMEARAALTKAARTEPLDPVLLKNLGAQIAGLETEAALLQGALFQKMKLIFTPEQFTKYTNQPGFQRPSSFRPGPPPASVVAPK